MKKQYKIYMYLALIGSILLGSLILVRFFSLSWVEVTDSQAKITINFLLPMAQDQLPSHIFLSNDSTESSNYTYTIHWLNPHKVELYIKEANAVKGLPLYLSIQKAPCKWSYLTKSKKIIVPFNVPIILNEVNETKLISSSETFSISFNTPIAIHTLRQFLCSEAAFEIHYETITHEGKQIIDPTRFLLKPKKPLENGKTYTLLVASGLKALSGRLLTEDLKLYLKVDQKPSFVQTYPEAGDKWIGLYPKITFKAKTPIKKAIAKINNETLIATMCDETSGYFLLSNKLAPGQTYLLEMQLKAASGELSEIKAVHFSTTSVNNQRSWLEINCGKQKCIHYYEGEKCIKTMICGIGKEISASDYGTYYLLDKNEVYENASDNEGANYWMMINPHIGIHGITRNSLWEIDASRSGDIGGFTKGKNIILSDQDASWLYQKITSQTMVIIKE